MTRYSVTVHARSPITGRAERPLVPDPRPFATLRDAKAWVSRMSITWIDALYPTELCFVALALDDEGAPAWSIEWPSDGSEAVEHDREDLKAMRGAA